MKNVEKNESNVNKFQDIKRKTLAYTVIGIIIFTMVFSVFAGLVSALH